LAYKYEYTLTGEAGVALSFHSKLVLTSMSPFIYKLLWCRKVSRFERQDR